MLARRFAVVCGGPESVGLLGFQRTPLWRGEAVYLPSYQPLYGHAREQVLPAAQRLIERNIGVWAPIVLHWGWEADEDWLALERLLARDRPVHGSLAGLSRRRRRKRRPTGMKWARPAGCPPPNRPCAHVHPRA